MGTRGRKSSAELELVTNVEEINRPEPPEYLTDEQALEWTEIVRNCAAGMFPRERHASLAGHCTHIVQRRKLAKMILEYENSPDYKISEYKKLCDMHATESAAVDRTAVRLGIAYSTAYEKRKTKAKTTASPWHK